MAGYTSGGSSTRERVDAADPIYALCYGHALQSPFLMGHRHAQPLRPDRRALLVVLLATTPGFADGYRAWETDPFTFAPEAQLEGDVRCALERSRQPGFC